MQNILLHYEYGKLAADETNDMILSQYSSIHRVQSVLPYLHTMLSLKDLK